MKEQQLRERRDALTEQVAQEQFDLGGLAYEMAIRDHFRLDVLVRRAAVLQQLDAELGEVQRLLAGHESATAGSCPSCQALHGRGAVFCWQCGAPLVARTTVNGVSPTADAARLEPDPHLPGQLPPRGESR
ncbi:MAG: hypothetical protein M3376_06120 [Actinomycetota bacterium]|nr:hypothetical protein [Actinomycetota bacterium]